MPIIVLEHTTGRFAGMFQIMGRNGGEFSLFPSTFTDIDVPMPVGERKHLPLVKLVAVDEKWAHYVEIPPDVPEETVPDAQEDV